MNATAKLFVAIAFVLANGCTVVHSADIRLTNNPLCAFQLEGNIVPGDQATLANLFRSEANQFDDLNERTFSLCLRSPGGSFAEALKIAELLYDRGVSTVIPDGSECFSACAIIFMAGVYPDKIMPGRKLSAGAVLGFHAPYLSMPDDKYNKQQVEGAAQAMRMAILALVKLSTKATKLNSEDFLKKSLIFRILENGPNQVIFVKSIFDAARWNIDIFDADKVFHIDHGPESLKNICNNFHYGNMDMAVPEITSYNLKIDNYESKFIKDDFRILLQDSRTKDTVCELYPRQFKNEQDIFFRACSFDYWSNKSFGDCREYKIAAPIRVGKFVPRFYALNPEMPLKRFRK